jgi:FkbM family methyltransferase
MTALPPSSDSRGAPLSKKTRRKETFDEMFPVGKQRRKRRLKLLAFRLLGKRCVFIDCGANVGEILKKQMINFPEFQYHAFEPNPELVAQLKQSTAGLSRRLKIHEKAVWIEDGTVDFFLSRENARGETVTDGSTVVPGKIATNPKSGQVDYQHPMKVPCIDFSRWIRRTFRRWDYIIVKMDIEGAEYQVLRKMIKDGTLRYIDLLLAEFHYKDGDQVKLSSVSEEEHRFILETVRRETNLIEWF